MCSLHFRFGDIISKIKQFMDRAQRSSIWESFNAKPLARLVVSHIGAVLFVVWDLRTGLGGNSNSSESENSTYAKAGTMWI